MFRVLNFRIFIVLSLTTIASACLPGGNKQYSLAQKNWCKKDLNRCAKRLCKENGDEKCDDDFINNVIIPELKRQFYGTTVANEGIAVTTVATPKRCQKFDSECKNKSYRCVKTKCVKKESIITGKYCERFDTECQHSKLICDENMHKCVPKNPNDSRVNFVPIKQNKTCVFSPDCEPDYKCVDAECVLGDLD